MIFHSFVGVTGATPHPQVSGKQAATLTVIVYPLLLRRRARDKAVENAERAHAELHPSPNR